ncbi:unnamed protein product [Clonostachys rosea]|uniref:Arrestin-like N-terminal domain-containing protein n=1 Tax=Bionectria ochroleuca TaxID=29856 RepID=A0ABY6U6L2_BIOOC|nr:unnamed protein product [Clonostachys rosea]
MPRTRVKSSDALGIDLDDGRVLYLPGDTITGAVFRQQTIVSPEATVSLFFHGRTKTLFVVSTGQSTVVYRGRFTLVNISQELFSGPLHIPKDSDKRREWKFTVKIPEKVDPSLLPPFIPHESYLNPATVDMDAMSLPASFISSRGSDQAFIEYYLEVKIRFQKERSWVEETAKMPIRILAHPHPPTDPASTSAVRIPRSITSQRLLPGMENAHLTAGQRFKKLVGASSVPSLAFHLELDLPNEIHVDQCPVPIMMRAVPYWPSTHEALKNQPQKVRLVDFKATLESRCGILCEGFSWAISKTSWKQKMVLPTGGQGQAGTIEIPFSSEGPAIDIGQALDLWVESEGKNSAAFQDFTTFNITLKHKLYWAARLEIAQETIYFNGVQDIVILPATDSSDAPDYIESEPLPEYETDSSKEAVDRKGKPPSFEEAQRTEETHKKTSNSKGK